MASTIFADEFKNTVTEKNNWAQKPDTLVFGQKVGLITSLFGCWHENISRPFVQGKTAYRSCLKCGARKQFDQETLETHGKFYFPPVASVETGN